MQLTGNERSLCMKFFSEFFTGRMNPALGEIWPLVAELLEMKDAPAAFGLEEKKVFAKLFYGVGDDTLALAESCWLHPERLHCQEPCMAAQKAYEEAGVAPGTDANLEADHLAVMCGFAAWCHDSGRDLSPFAKVHFGRWIPALERAVADRTDNVSIRNIFAAFTKLAAAEAA